MKHRGFRPPILSTIRGDICNYLVHFQLELSSEIRGFGTKNSDLGLTPHPKIKPEPTPFLLPPAYACAPHLSKPRALRGLDSSARSRDAAARGCARATRVAARLLPLAPAGDAKKGGERDRVESRREI